jgi:F0F1-type ATP synthase delta subunit
VVFQLILFQIITFAVIIAVLRFIFGTQLKIALGRLEDLHQESVEKEEILNKEIERARTLSQTEIARSKEEAKLILENARRHAERISQEALEQAGGQAKRLLSEASDHAKSVETELAWSIEEKALGLGSRLLATMLSDRGFEVLHRHLVDEFLDELERTDRERLAAAGHEVDVATAYPLVDASRERLATLLSGKLGGAVRIAVQDDSSLLGGIVVKLGGVILDGSLKNKLQKGLQALKTRA